MKGNWNKILKLNLGTGAVGEISIPEEIWRDFIGGSGVGAWIYKEYYFKKTEENPLIVLAGPITGTTFPGSSRFAVCTRSPLTNMWGEGTCGGNFGPMLKACGVDGIIIEGKASKPVYIMMENKKVTLVDAADLWGKDTYETIDILEAKHGKRARVLTIGPAGEHGVKYANICNDKGDFIGRTGMGCVMGGKNLKALVVTGTEKVAVADTARYDTLRKKVLEQIKASTPALSLHDMGTDASMDLGMMTGDIPIRNWSIGEDFDVSAALGGPTMTEKFLVKRSACLYCPIACRRVMKVADGPYKMDEGPGPEYETCCSLGSNIHNLVAEGTLKANELANKMGMDTISLGNTVSMAIDCFENGLLKEQDWGMKLSFGEIDNVLKVIPMIARREGLGDMLADGTRALAEKLGGNAADYAVHVKGLELPMHDPHGWTGLGLSYMMSTRGACHLQHLVHPIEQGMVFYEGIGLTDNFDGQKSEGKGKMVKVAEDMGVPANAMVLCQFVGWCMKTEDFPEILAAVTGFEFDLEKFMKAGARIWLLKRSLNNLMGITAKDDTLPPKILKPYKEGNAAGNVPNVELMRKEYYAERGLEADGRPSKATLDAVGGLEDVKKLLYG